MRGPFDCLALVALADRVDDRPDLVRPVPKPDDAEHDVGQATKANL
jgi:hypothetical protein